MGSKRIVLRFFFLNWDFFFFFFPPHFTKSINNTTLNKLEESIFVFLQVGTKKLNKPINMNWFGVPVLQKKAFKFNAASTLAGLASCGSFFSAWKLKMRKISRLFLKTCVSLNLNFCLLKIIILYVFWLFWYVDLKNKFLKIKKI
jgi:hypothetical protein